MNGYLALIKEQREECDKKDKEIKRLNKKYEDAVADYEEQKYIINELEKDMRETIEILKTTEYQKIDIDYVIETLDIYCDRLKKS